MWFLRLRRVPRQRGGGSRHTAKRGLRGRSTGSRHASSLRTTLDACRALAAPSQHMGHAFDERHAWAMMRGELRRGMGCTALAACALRIQPLFLLVVYPAHRLRARATSFAVPSTMFCRRRKARPLVCALACAENGESMLHAVSLYGPRPSLGPLPRRQTAPARGHARTMKAAVRRA